MTDKQQAALDVARQHTQAVAAYLKRAGTAHAEGDDATVQRCHRAASASCEALDSAHDALERALSGPDDYIEPTHNTAPGAQGGAQTSSGREPRSYTPEEIRQRDQRTSVDAAYRRRIAEEARQR
jgi:hypothetical protein